MKITYDPEGDVLYIELRHAKAEDSVDVEPGVSVDLDANGHVIGIEILDAKERIGADPLAAVSIERLMPEVEDTETPAEVA